MYKISESPHVVESTTVMDPGFHVVDFGFPVLNSHSLPVELGFQTPIVKWDSGFLKLYSGFISKISRIPKSNSGIRIPLYGAKTTLDGPLLFNEVAQPLKTALSSNFQG